MLVGRVASPLDNMDYVPRAYPLCIHHKADHTATGHSRVRDIINPLKFERALQGLLRDLDGGVARHDQR